VLTVTEAASANLAQMIKQQGAPEDIAVRFVYEGHGVASHRDSQRAGDTASQHEARTVLLLDAQVSKLLAADRLDLVGAKLALKCPKEGE